MKQRIVQIDVLRAAAIFGFIGIHILAYHEDSPTHEFIWNYLHFVVVAFVFCSGYVMARIGPEELSSFRKVALWYYRRLIRLLLPYYFFLAALYAVSIVLPRYFTGLDLQRNWQFVVSSVFLTGGSAQSWLPLLFLMLAALYPLFLFLERKPLCFWTYVLGSAVITLYGTLRPFPYAIYRWEMWLPWSLVTLLAIWLARREHEEVRLAPQLKRIVIVGIVAAVLFFLLNDLYKTMHISLRLADHKYPPDYFYLSYAITVCMIWLVAGHLQFWQFGLVRRFIIFTSKQSYALYFVSYIVLDFDLWLSKQLAVLHSVFGQFVFVSGASLVICWMLQYLDLSALVRRHFLQA